MLTLTNLSPLEIKKEQLLKITELTMKGFNP